MSISNAILNLRATQKREKFGVLCKIIAHSSYGHSMGGFGFKFILDMETCRYISFMKKLKCATLFSYEHEQAVDLATKWVTSEGKV